MDGIKVSYLRRYDKRVSIDKWFEGEFLDLPKTFL